ncbi:MAG TPA: hypothetical protein VH593_06815 [Ktedonobacteraceae bacterium]|jgi:chromosome segregation ATPase
MATPHESTPASQEAVKDGQIRFVGELADQQDYWMSLTDAARITRTSETMVRRWVTTGRLPIKREPAGINQRTRLVRASDVASIRPIVDPTAAITDEIHKLDLLSIPRQQAQILQDHQRLLTMVQQGHQQLEEHLHHTRSALEKGAMELQQQVQEWDRRFSEYQTVWQQAHNLQQQQHEAFTVQVQQRAQETEQRITQLETQGKQQQRMLEDLANQFEKTQYTVQESLQAMQRHLDKFDQGFQQQTERMYHELNSRLEGQEKRFQDTLGRTEETFMHHNLAQKQLQDDLQNLRQGLSTQHKTLVARIEQQGNEVKRALEQQWLEQVQERDNHIRMLEQQLEAVVTQEQATREQAKTQGQRLESLTVILQEEQAARQSLAEQLALQQEQLQAFCLKYSNVKAGQIEAE